MSIQREGRAYVPTCDICGDTLPDEYDFNDAVTAKKREGWKSRKVNGEWEDVCTCCQLEEQEGKSR